MYSSRTSIAARLQKLTDIVQPDRLSNTRPNCLKPALVTLWQLLKHSRFSGRSCSGPSCASIILEQYENSRSVNGISLKLSIPENLKLYHRLNFVSGNPRKASSPPSLTAEQACNSRSTRGKPRRTPIPASVIV